MHRIDVSRDGAREKYSLIYTRVKYFRTNEKREIVDTDEEENLVASSIERSIVIAVELRSPLARFPLLSTLKFKMLLGTWENTYVLRDNRASLAKHVVQCACHSPRPHRPSITTSNSYKNGVDVRMSY